VIRDETGVEFRIVGFDTGKGLPEPEGCKDHPELWTGGDFFPEDPARLQRQIAGRAELVLGDIHDTIGPFVASLEPGCPLGFVSVDVDIYSATVAALRGLEGPADRYLPAISCYFDDVAFYFANDWCGELAAIREFNDAHGTRKIGPDRSLPGARPVAAATWYTCMYAAHILDHPLRTSVRRKGELHIRDHHDFMSRSHLY
jgi:hypothetical protein